MSDYKPSTVGWSKLYPAADLSPQQFRHHVQNIHSVYQTASPEVREQGKHWYDDVHEAVTKGVRRTGLSHRQGSGLVAVVSPNMDWENKNIGALKELTHMKQSHWDVVERGNREEVSHMLSGQSISQTPTGALQKAHRIMQGEDPAEVMPRGTAPKTHSFFHNIHEPQSPGPVTIDSRAHDIAVNRKIPWVFTGRRIGSGGVQQERYSHFEDAYRGAARVISHREGSPLLLPHQVQAITWEAGKRLERSAPTKSGAPRRKGESRKGQPYV